MGNGWNNLLLICAAGLTFAWLVAAQRRLVASAARRFVALPRLQQMLAIFAVCILTVCAQKQDREIIELSNNRIIESAEAEASGSDDSRRVAEKAEGETDVPQAEEESLSNHNSIIRTFDYSIIDSDSSATSQTSKLRAKTLLTSLSSNPCQSVQSVASQAGSECLSNRNSIIRTFDYSIIEPFPAYTNVVTNLCATAIRPAETSVFLRVHWPPVATNVATSRLRVKEGSNECF